MARWSRGMIRASDARGPGFKSRASPSLFLSAFPEVNQESKNFLYFNDDLSLLRPICLDDFLSSNGTFKLYIKPKEITKYGKEKKYNIKCHPSCERIIFINCCHPIVGLLPRSTREHNMKLYIA